MMGPWQGLSIFQAGASSLPDPSSTFIFLGWPYLVFGTCSQDSWHSQTFLLQKVPVPPPTSNFLLLSSPAPHPSSGWGCRGRQCKLAMGQQQGSQNLRRYDSQISLRKLKFSCIIPSASIVRGGFVFCFLFFP
jgi:hypothetical protein